MTDDKKVVAETPQFEEKLPVDAGLAINPFVSMMQLALSKGVEIDVLERMAALVKEEQAAQAKRDYNQALANFQGEMPPIKMTGKVDYKDSKHRRIQYTHGELSEAVRIARPLLAKYGLSTRFEQKESGNQIQVTCFVQHASGHETSYAMSGAIDLSGNKSELKGRASTKSYLSRYAYTGALGIVFEKEDEESDLPNTPPFDRASVEDQLKQLLYERNFDFEDYLNWLSHPQNVGRKITCLRDLRDDEINKALIGLQHTQ